MKTLEVLSRTRYKKLYNILPEEIARKACPPFFTTVKEPYIDWESIRKNYQEELVQFEPEKKEQIKRRQTIKKNSQISQISPIFSKNSILTEVKQVKFQENKEQIAKPIQFIPYSQESCALFDKGCITCGKENIKVEFYDQRHMCLECRSFLKTYYDDPAILFLNEDDNIEVYGIKNIQDNNNQQKRVYYQVPEDELKFNKYRAYATIAGIDELIVLLHDNQQLLK